MIGEQMYNYMKDNNKKVDGKSMKLTQMLDTKYCKSSRLDNNATVFISTFSYYLWFLLDIGYHIDDIKSLITFTKQTGLKSFTEELMNLRQLAIIDNNKGVSNFYKLCLNSSYVQEILNEEKYSKMIL
jgi:hypothetical protein